MGSQISSMNFFQAWGLSLLVCLTACSSAPDPSDSSEAKSQLVANMKRATDNHSYSRPEEAMTTHLHWEAQVDFDKRQIQATATYDIKVASDAERLMLDCRDLTIHKVTVDGSAVDAELGPTQPFIGQPLSIPIGPNSKKVSVEYTTSPDAAAFLWVEGEKPVSVHAKSSHFGADLGALPGQPRRQVHIQRGCGGSVGPHGFDECSQSNGQIGRRPVSL